MKVKNVQPENAIGIWKGKPGGYASGRIQLEAGRDQLGARAVFYVVEPADGEVIK